MHQLAPDYHSKLTFWMRSLQVIELSSIRRLRSRENKFSASFAHHLFDKQATPFTVQTTVQDLKTQFCVNRIDCVQVSSLLLLLLAPTVTDTAVLQQQL